MMLNVIEGTNYCYDFLNNYFDEEKFLSKDLLFGMLFDEIITAIDTLQLNKIEQERLENAGSNEEMELVFRDIVPNYSTIVEGAVSRLLRRYVDVERTVVEG